MREIFEELAKKIITKEELVFFLDQINLIQREVFKNIREPLSERVEGKISQDFRKGLGELEKKKIISENPEENRIFFENFKKYLQNLPQIKIEVAFKPEREFIDKISSFLEKESGQKIILDLIFNSEIVGGAIIEFKGKQINLSLAKKIDELQLKIKD